MEIFTSQGAPLVSTTPAVYLPPVPMVSLILVANLPSVSATQVANSPPVSAKLVAITPFVNMSTAPVAANNGKNIRLLTP